MSTRTRCEVCLAWSCDCMTVRARARSEADVLADEARERVRQGLVCAALLTPAETAMRDRKVRESRDRAGRTRSIPPETRAAVYERWRTSDLPVAHVGREFSMDHSTVIRIVRETLARHGVDTGYPLRRLRYIAQVTPPSLAPEGRAA